MARILDASVLMHWLADEPLSVEATSLLESEERLLAPVLARSEVASGLWLQQRCGRMSQGEVLERMSALADSGVEFVDDPKLQLGAVRLAIELKHSTYDCEYLALALDRDAELITADDELWQLARMLIGERAIWLADVAT